MMTPVQAQVLRRMCGDAVRYRLPKTQGCCAPGQLCSDHRLDAADVRAYLELVAEVLGGGDVDAALAELMSGQRAGL